MLHQCHDAPTAGHPGKNGTLELVNHYYWWPGISWFVKKYIAGCDHCQRYKQVAHPLAKLHLLTVLLAPWVVVRVDKVTGLPECERYNAIVTYIDLYSKQAHFIPTTTDVDMAGIANLHY